MPSSVRLRRSVCPSEERFETAGIMEPLVIPLAQISNAGAQFRALQSAALMADYALQRDTQAVPEADKARLDDTLKNERFKIVYQPIVDVRKRSTFAYEALVRAELFRSPPELIEIAARSGRLGE